MSETDIRRHSPAAMTLAAYLSVRSGQSTSAHGRARASLPRRLVRAVVPVRARGALEQLATNALRPWERWQARRLASGVPLRLHLGSGHTPLRDWVNIDFLGKPAQLAWDLTTPLPFPDGSASVVFHEHLLEHLPVEVAVRLLRECHRLLEPEGVLRVGVPDAGMYLRAYAGAAGTDGFLDQVRPGRPTSLLAVREVFQDHGHRSAYDFETLALLLEASGFRDVERRPFGDSRIRPCPDGERRRLETLYVEGVR